MDDNPMSPTHPEDGHGAKGMTSKLLAWNRRIFQPENAIVVRLTQATILVAIWIGIASIFPENLMPGPVGTLETLYEMTFETGVVVEHSIVTIRRVLIAFGIAFCLSVVLGLLMGLSGLWRDFILPYLLVIIFVPGVLWALVILLAMGFGDVTAIVIALIGPTIYGTIQIWKATENIDQDLLAMARSFDISTVRLVRRVIIPDIAPALFGTGRFGLGLTVKVMLIAELFATSDGWGALIFSTYTGYRYQEAWAWALVIAVFIAVLEIMLRRLEKSAFEYRDERGLSSTAV